MASLTLRRAGLLTTVQDLGRFGYGRFGVPQAGALDPLALRLANRLVLNPDNTPALEITILGPEVAFGQPTCFSIGGANLSPTLDGKPVQVWESAMAGAGQTLRFGARRQGARCYLAVRGGIQASRIMGSAATDLDSGIGGIDGKPLRSGQVLEIGEQTPVSPRRLRFPFLRQYSNPFDLRFVPEVGGAFGEPVRMRFEGARYRVSAHSDRMGYRLEGPALPLSIAGDMISEAIPPGTIQIPPDGLPILLMSEGQSVAGGGYPRMGYVIRADLPKAAQLLAGHSIRFRKVGLEEARKALLMQEEALDAAIWTPSTATNASHPPSTDASHHPG